MNDYGQQAAAHAFDELPFGIWVGRADGEVLYTNRAFRALTGADGAPGTRVGDIPAAYGLHDREGKPYPAGATRSRTRDAVSGSHRLSEERDARLDDRNGTFCSDAYGDFVYPDASVCAAHAWTAR